MTAAKHWHAVRAACRQALAPLPLLLLVLPASDASAQGKAALIEICDDEKAPPAQRFVACTAVIDDPSATPRERADALVNRGGVADDQQRYDDAVADFTAAIGLVPNFAAAYLLRGNAWDAKGDLERALADYEAAVHLAPDDASGWFNRGTVHEAKGDTDRAAADYRKALEIDPAHEGAKDALASLQGKR